MLGAYFNHQLPHTIKTTLPHNAPHPDFKLACRSPHRRFEGNICTNAHAPHARGKTKWQATSCQLINNPTALPKVADHRQLKSIQLESNATR